MRDHGAQPSKQAFTSIADAFARQGNLEGAWRVVRQVSHLCAYMVCVSKACVNSCVYVLFLSLLSSLPLRLRASLTSAQMKGVGLALDTAVYNATLKAVASPKDLARIPEILTGANHFLVLEYFYSFLLS
jgi:pentatricopeptide repeat protein